MAELILLFVFWGLVNTAGVAGCCFAAAVDKEGRQFPFMYPSVLYHKSKLNVFGVAIVYLLYIIVFPVPFIITLIYWLIHVGRKKKTKDD